MTAAVESEQYRLPRLGVRVFGCGLVLGLAGSWPTYAAAGEGGIRAMALALASTTAVGYATLLAAMIRTPRTGAVGRLQLGFRMGVARLILTLVVAVLLAWRANVDRQVFLVWVAVSYVLLIKVETLTFVAWCKRFEER